MKTRNMVSFDWAMKRLLRNKANFEVLDYLKNNQIRDDFTAQGIDKARKILAYERLTEEEKREHDRLICNFFLLRISYPQLVK